MENLPILSICIPTDGSVQWVLPVLDSIYAQGYDNSKFEVIVTDNGKDSQLPQHIAKYEYPNLKYKQTNDKGFLNLVTALKEGCGLFCKMLNHRSVLLPGSIGKLVDMVESYKETKPIIYCPNGEKKGVTIKECQDINEFLFNVSFYSSWSAGIGFWKDDIANIDNIRLDELFPNASLLFNIRKDAQYVIWNNRYMSMGDDAGKGGYDYFHTFCVHFLDLLSILRIEERITEKTFVSIKWDLYNFLKDVYLLEIFLPTSHTFILDDIKSSYAVYYGRFYYWWTILCCVVYYPIGLVKYLRRQYLKKKSK